jgi:DNA-binding NtrC family response regulator
MNSQTATTTSTTITTTALAPPAAGERIRGTVLCLIVHDELELRLRLAGLVRRAMPKIDADTVTRAGFDAISIERLRAYVAVMFIIEFSPPEAAAASLASLKRLHEQAPHLPIFVFARGGNERSAARAMKLGASDYWPIHSVIVGELCSALQPLIEPPPPAAGASSAAADRWRQPEVAGYTMMKKIAQSSAAESPVHCERARFRHHG